MRRRKLEWLSDDDEDLLALKRKIILKNLKLWSFNAPKDPLFL